MSFMSEATKEERQTACALSFSFFLCLSVPCVLECVFHVVNDECNFSNRRKEKREKKNEASWSRETLASLYICWVFFFLCCCVSLFGPLFVSSCLSSTQQGPLQRRKKWTCVIQSVKNSYVLLTTWGGTCLPPFIASLFRCFVLSSLLFGWFCLSPLNSFRSLQQHFLLPRLLLDREQFWSVI